MSPRTKSSRQTSESRTVVRLPAEPQETPTEEPHDSLTVTIRIPLGDLKKEFYPSSVNFMVRDPDQQKALHRIYEGLREQGTILKSGHHVDVMADVVRWILDQVD